MRLIHLAEYVISDGYAGRVYKLRGLVTFTTTMSGHILLFPHAGKVVRLFCHIRISVRLIHLLIQGCKTSLASSVTS